MQLGINYPWFDYGKDFGSPGRPKWLDVIGQDFLFFEKHNIEVVRWFILAEGWHYGVGKGNIPEVESDPRSRGQWRFHRCPRVDEKILRDLQLLLEQFAAAEVCLLPVIIDFHFLKPYAHAELGNQHDFFRIVA